MDEVALGTKEDILLTLPRSDFKNIKAIIISKITSKLLFLMEM